MKVPVFMALDRFAVPRSVLVVEDEEAIAAFVVQGLTEGDQVVASGQFLVDSEARLRSVLGSMAAAQPMGGAK